MREINVVQEFEKVRADVRLQIVQLSINVLRTRRRAIHWLRSV